MELSLLRAIHREFIYESFSYNLDGEILKIKFHFKIQPDIEFSPTLEIPVEQNEIVNIDNFVFHLGLIEMLSYWKATCSPKIIIKAGKLTDVQVLWWKDLFINGLGEFYYQNNIDFTATDFLEINSSGQQFALKDHDNPEGNLVLIGGGKDSAVTAELLQRKNALLLNPTKAALEVCQIAGFKKNITVKRTIDPRLLQLNEQGYLNGHTPFSAYLSFLSLLVARVYGFESIVVSNETSAQEPNLEYRGLQVNHQYSKSYDYEKRFREYIKQFLSKKINYFSFLRPLNELQIAALFIQTEKYDSAFNSCNVGRGNYWCGSCPKCAFIYLLLSGLIDKPRLKKIFGEKDFFENEKIKGYIRDLTGEGKHKPLDCVGTEEESQMALKLIKGTDRREKEEIYKRIKSDWSDEHFLPKEYRKILKEKMRDLNI